MDSLRIVDWKRGGNLAFICIRNFVLSTGHFYLWINVVSHTKPTLSIPQGPNQNSSSESDLPVAFFLLKIAISSGVAYRVA